MRLLLCVSVLGSAMAWGQNRPIAPTDCDDNYSECKEDCAIRFGGTTSLKSRAKLNPCLNKCDSTERDCRETFFETKRNNLDEGAISGSPSSRDVDSDGMPTTSRKKQVVEKKKEDDLRDSAPPPAKKSEPAPKPAYELKEEETPKSNRSQLKVEKEKPAKVESKPEPVRESAPPPRKEEPKKSSGLDSDVRSEDSAAPPAKKQEKKEDPKKDNEKKKRALDEWDPEAM